MTDPTPTPATPRQSRCDPPLSSVWLVAQSSSRAQRAGRYLPATVTHPAKMLPALAAAAIHAYTRPGQLVLDPMCGTGTTLVEAVHAGRDAVGVEYEPRWAGLARANLGHATDHGAPGHAAVATGDARHAAALLGGDLAGRVSLLLTSPPYGPSTHGQVHAPGTGKVRKRHYRYSHDPANLAHQPLPDLLDGLAGILRACLPLLAPGATVVLTTRPYRHHGQLVDLPGAVLHTAASVGLHPVGRYAALLAGVRGGRLVPRASFFQLTNTRAAHAAGTPVHAVAHEDVLVLRYPATPDPSPDPGRCVCSRPPGRVEHTHSGTAAGPAPAVSACSARRACTPVRALPADRRPPRPAPPRTRPAGHPGQESHRP